MAFTLTAVLGISIAFGTSSGNPATSDESAPPPEDQPAEVLFSQGFNDYDGDGIPDLIDNCVYSPNPLQEDSDGNGVGDACECCAPHDWPYCASQACSTKVCSVLSYCCVHAWDELCTCVALASPECPCGTPPDSDSDGWADSCDNCPSVWNPNQADSDWDGYGDACDSCPQDPFHHECECDFPPPVQVAYVGGYAILVGQWQTPEGGDNTVTPAGPIIGSNGSGSGTTGSGLPYLVSATGTLTWIAESSHDPATLSLYWGGTAIDTCAPGECLAQIRAMSNSATPTLFEVDAPCLVYTTEWGCNIVEVTGTIGSSPFDTVLSKGIYALEYDLGTVASDGSTNTQVCSYVFWALAPGFDDDFDSVANCTDNCPVQPNGSQSDVDGDGVGDACDNCVYAFNPAQEDQDLDRTGDACECPADFDRSGIVNGADLAVVLGWWGACGNPAADIDEDGCVTGADLTFLLGAWGPCP